MFNWIIFKKKLFKNGITWFIVCLVWGFKYFIHGNNMSLNLLLISYSFFYGDNNNVHLRDLKWFWVIIK